MVKTLPFRDAMVQLKLPELKRNLFSSDDWIGIILNTYNARIFVKYIERDGQVASYIIYSVVKNFLEWKICFLSYSDYCDAYVATLADWQSFLVSLRAEYPQYRFALRNLRDPLPRQMPEFKHLSSEKFHLLDLRLDLRQLWKNTHDSFKSAVKQAENSGVIVRRCEKKELKKFYDLHLSIRKHKYKIFPQPYRFFDVIWDQMIAKGNGALLGAYSPGGEFIGGNIYLLCGNTFYYKFNTSSLAALKYRPNNLLFWEGIKYAKALKCQFLDLGSSGLEQSGLILFKNHTGATMSEIQHLGFEPQGYKFSQKRILKIMTKLFTLPHVPNALVRWGSSIIYPYLA
ncbi:MAG: GNAT family N-acetyltransferase [Candidatus Omnitrophica bacterium]|nr:GNAT family N-acetyltransferase [Candidatus Omnitrophota bacterium]